jgi:hypothetical protein
LRCRALECKLTSSWRRFQLLPPGEPATPSAVFSGSTKLGRGLLAPQHASAPPDMRQRVSRLSKLHSKAQADALLLQQNLLFVVPTLPHKYSSVKSSKQVIN